MLKPGHLELFVEDPLRTRRFYAEVLGYSVTTVQEGQFVWLQLGAQEILLRPGPRQAPPQDYDHARIGMVLYTDDLPQAVAHLEKHGVTFCATPDGCYTFADPDGNWFQLVDPRSHA